MLKPGDRIYNKKWDFYGIIEDIFPCQSPSCDKESASVQEGPNLKGIYHTENMIKA